MSKTVNVLGATGLVGRELVNQLLRYPGISKVKVFVRRDMGINHPRFEQHIVDFDRIGSWEPFLEGDILFSAMGTTLKSAGSKTAQYKVDYTYQYRFGEEASRKGIPVYILVSSTGANPESAVFYSRMKGELDEAVRRLEFQKTVILRPSILTGDREKKRPVEKFSIIMMKWITRFIFRDYRPVPAATVAAAMIHAALQEQPQQYTIVNPREIFLLAEHKLNQH